MRNPLPANLMTRYQPMLAATKTFDRDAQRV
jgi:hypothetical protein